MPDRRRAVSGACHCQRDSLCVDFLMGTDKAPSELSSETIATIGAGVGGGGCVLVSLIVTLVVLRSRRARNAQPEVPPSFRAPDEFQSARADEPLRDSVRFGGGSEYGSSVLANNSALPVCQYSFGSINLQPASTARP
jgi:hypothetical protein